MSDTRSRVLAGGAGLAFALLAWVGIMWAVQPAQIVSKTVEVPGPTIHTTHTITTSQALSQTVTATSTISVPVTATEYVDVTQYEPPTTVTVDAQGAALSDQPGISGSAATPLVTKRETVSVEPATVEVVPTTADVPAATSNWMDELGPQVDPSGLGVWLFQVHPETGSWGTTDGYTVWIDPDVPEDARYSVMVHEYAHILQRVHYGSLDAAAKQLDFESLADCMARQMGATVLSYGCDEALAPIANQILGG